MEEIKVEVDHKPLIGISKKPYATIFPHYQLMLLLLNRYNIELEYDSKPVDPIFTTKMGRICIIYSKCPRVKRCVFYIKNGWTKQNKNSCTSLLALYVTKEGIICKDTS